MFFLGALFALLWATAYLLGRKIERERAAAYAALEPSPPRSTSDDRPLAHRAHPDHPAAASAAAPSATSCSPSWARRSSAHVAVDAGDHPVALPVAYGVDPDGPDEGGTLYVHGSVGAGWMRSAPGTTVCVTVTAVDGLVLARSGFHHSMNYRCAVVIGTARLVESEEERARALDLVVDQIVPGRAATLRAHTRKELAATAVLAVPLREASLKVRDRRRRRRARGRRGRRSGPACSRCGWSPARSRATPTPRGPVPDDVAARAGAAARIGCRPCRAPWSCSSPTPYAAAWWGRSCPASRPRG